MVGSQFANCWLKLGRAEEHFSTVKSDLIAWKESQPYIVTKKSDANGSRHSLIIEIKGSPPLDRCSVVSGDCIHNLRAALDNLVYAVAVQESGADPPPKFMDLQFPITDTPRGFADKKWRIASLSDRTQTRIERAQPYNRPHTELPPLLRLLSDFDNTDKHRRLNVVITNVGGGKFSFTPLPDQPIFIPPHVEFLRGAVESGAEIAWFTIHPPQRDVDYHYKASFVVSIAHAAGPNGHAISELAYILEILIREVKRIVEKIGL
jgi:hypothetical protein